MPPTYPDPRFDQPPPRPPPTATVPFDGLFPTHPHKSPRKRQKRSVVWNFFKESDSDPNVADCQICKSRIPRGKNLARNTTNLRKHLEHRHPEFATYVNRKRPPTATSQFSASRKRPTLPPPANSLVKPPSHPALPQPHALPPQMPSPAHSHLDDSANVLPMHSPPVSTASAFPPHSVPLAHPAPALYAPNPTPQLHSDPATSDLPPSDQAHSQPLPAHPPLQPVPNSQHLLQSSSLTHTQLHPASQPLPLPPQAHPPKLLQHPQQQHHSSHSAVLPQISWTPSKPQSPLPPPPASDTLPTLMESSTNTNLATTTSQDANFALLRFLAVNHLPLSISSSNDFRQLFHLVQDRPNFPNVSTLRTSVLNAQVQDVRNKIGIALENADSIILKVENGHLGQRFVVCEYFYPPLQRCSVLLDIFTEEDLSVPNASGGMSMANNPCSLSDAYNICTARRLSETPAQQNLIFGRLINRMTMIIDFWRIRSKLKAIVLSETVFSGDEPLYLSQVAPPAPGNTLELQGSYRLGRGPCGASDLGFDDAHCDTATIPAHRDRIPIVSCVIRTLTNIFEQVFSNDDMLERRFVGPMSRAMHKVLTDSEFRLTEACAAWPHHLRLPMHKLSLWELSSVLGFFSDHIETVQGVVKRSCENHSYDFLFVLKDEVMYLHSLVNIFKSAVKRLSGCSAIAYGNGSYMSGGERASCTWFTENLSAGIPALRNVLKELEGLPPAVSEEVRALRKVAMESTQRHLACMETQDLFLCSTLLDPRYRQGYFSSKEMTASAERMVLDAFEDERRKGDNQKNGKSAEALLNGCVGSSSSFEQYMSSIIPETTSGSCSLTQYLSEQLSEACGGEEFWRRNQHRWPLLSRVAARYCLAAGVCESEEVRLELEREQSMSMDGDTRKKEQISEKLGMAFLRKNYMPRE
eukprot:TRINITY_DN55500_c0_g1_i1.p1 TRINITY_DN55500_c0_g1~~TRINITY_DN55500_c0_g1_i1.p1  ORF type:complete len:1013 (-),score=159.92 TRINITY_DN55500_c0_g1_i1:755-3517(-)